MRQVTPFDARAYHYYYGARSTATRAIGNLGGWGPLSLAPSLFLLARPPYLFQTTDESTPVTTDGQTAGRINDLSATGANLTQGTAANEPTYHVSGNVHWLEADGTNDFMAAASFSLAQPFEVVVAARFLSTQAGTRPIMALGAASPLLYREGGTGLRIFAAGGVELESSFSPANNVDFVAFGQFNGASSAIIVDNNAPNTGDPGSQAAAALQLFTRNSNTAECINARFYGCAVFPFILTASQRAQVLTYFAALQGRAL